METFKLVSKITAKHLMARFKGGKTEAPKKPAAKKSAKAPEPEPLPPPFPDAVPFPESPMNGGYEKMEEVSLEDLLSEGRERPATMSGNVPVPVVEEIEELGDHELVPADESVAVAVLDEPAPPLAGINRLPVLEKQVAALESQIETMRAQHRAALEDLVRELSDLVSRIRSQLDQ